MTLHQPISLPSNHYQQFTAQPVHVSSSIGTNNSTRKRKQFTSSNETYFYDNQWQADLSPSDPSQTLNQHQHQHEHQHEHQHQEKYWYTPQDQRNSEDNPKSSDYNNIGPLPQQQHPQTQGPFVFDTYQNYEQYQQHNDTIERILQTQTLHDKYLDDDNSRLLYSDTQKQQPVPWEANLTINQSTTTDQLSSHSSMDSSNDTALCPQSFLDSLPDIGLCNNTDFAALKFDALLDTPLISSKSVHSLPLSTSTCDQSNDSGGLLPSNIQNNTTSLSTGGTPPISPATMASTHSSPAITPMGGRTSSLTIVNPQYQYHHHHTTTPSRHLNHQHASSLPSPTGAMTIATKTKNNFSNSNDDGNMVVTVNEGPVFDTFPFNQQSTTTTPMEFVMDYWSQYASNPSSTSSSTTTNTALTMEPLDPPTTVTHTHDAPNSSLRSVPARNLHVVAAARVIQQQETTARIRPIIQQYLQSKNPAAMGEKTVIIMSSKVAQKSYGTEKRFLCPPPTAILIGSTWWTKQNKSIPANTINLTSKDTSTNNNNIDDDNGDDGNEQQQISFYDGHGNATTEMVPPKVTISISGESSSQAGQMEWYIQANGAVAGQTGLSQQQQTQSAQSLQDPSNTRSRFKNLSSMETKNNGGDWYHNPRSESLGGGRCVSKQLYISDADEKRKRVECLVKLQIHGLWMGTLAGKGIKVISKPSKKRQSVKNMELCIHHGSVVSLFNRIRSQTVSTKYLGVSNGKGCAFSYPGQILGGQTKNNDGACFVARTASWDPFVIWLVDTSRSFEQQQKNRNNNSAKNSSNYPEDYIGHRNFKPSVNYPPPPAIALLNTTQQPLAIHYNQHIVLQCLTTGLVSPVMVIRRVDKASTVVGGARCMDETLHINGGEYGDEYLGDPVCQLHKIALQIVQEPPRRSTKQQQQHNDTSTNVTTGLMEDLLPRHNSPIAYLACLNDIVGMHKSTEIRQPILKSPPPPPPPSYQLPAEFIQDDGRAAQKRKISTFTSSSSLANINHGTQPVLIMDNIGKNDSKTVSTYSQFDSIYESQQRQPRQGSTSANTAVNEFDNSVNWTNHRSRSVSVPESRHRAFSSSSSSSSSATTATALPISPSSTSWINGPLGGAYWHEDVSDAAVWTIVGTDIASYTFLPPTQHSHSSKTSVSSGKNHADNNTKDPLQQQPHQYHSRGSTAGSSSSMTFPHLSHYSIVQQDNLLHLHGSHMARDIQVWLGDIQAPHVEYKSRELLICRLPPRNELLACSLIESYQTSSPITTSPTAPPPHANNNNNNNNNTTTLYQLPVLLVKTADDIIHNTNIHYQF